MRDHDHIAGYACIACEVQETNRLLVVATRAAHKLHVNRAVHQYPWMDQISSEVADLEAEGEALKAECDRRALNWRGQADGHD